MVVVQVDRREGGADPLNEVAVQVAQAEIETGNAALCPEVDLDVPGVS